MINYQFRNLLIIKDLLEKRIPYEVIVKKSALHPFVVKKSYEQCRGFSFTELKKIYQRIFQVDLDIKTGRIEPEMALDIFVAGI
jgi:DNA polymerase-3 subunit delta